MGISNDTKIIFENGSTIEVIQADDNNIRLSSKMFPFTRRYLSVRYNDFLQEGVNIMSKNLTEDQIKAYEAFSQSSVCEATLEKKPKTMNILKLWKDKQVSHVTQQYEKVKDNVHKEDSLYKTLLNLALKMVEEISKENPSEIESRRQGCDVIAKRIVTHIGKSLAVYTKDTTEKVHRECDKCSLAQSEIDSDFNEIKTMLSACDTYEQEMEVLKNYGVVDKNGKLNTEATQCESL